MTRRTQFLYIAVSLIWAVILVVMVVSTAVRTQVEEGGVRPAAHSRESPEVEPAAITPVAADDHDQ